MESKPRMLTAREVARVYKEAGKRKPDRRDMTRDENSEYLASIAAELYPGRRAPFTTHLRK